jgi:hypothetical protein
MMNIHSDSRSRLVKAVLTGFVAITLSLGAMSTLDIALAAGGGGGGGGGHGGGGSSHGGGGGFGGDGGRGGFGVGGAGSQPFIEGSHGGGGSLGGGGSFGGGGFRASDRRFGSYDGFYGRRFRGSSDSYACTVGRPYGVSRRFCPD